MKSIAELLEVDIPDAVRTLIPDDSADRQELLTNLEIVGGKVISEKEEAVKGAEAAKDQVIETIRQEKEVYKVKVTRALYCMGVLGIIAEKSFGMYDYIASSVAGICNLACSAPACWNDMSFGNRMTAGTFATAAIAITCSAIVVDAIYAFYCKKSSQESIHPSRSNSHVNNEEEKKAVSEPTSGYSR